MNDLLNEEEFILKKKFSPRDTILKFCCIAVVQVTVFFIFDNRGGGFFIDEKMVVFYQIWGFSNFLFPLVLAFLMIFSKKEMLLRPLKISFWGLVSLAGTYSVGFFVGNILHLNRTGKIVDAFEITFPFTLGFFYFIMFCVIVLPIAHFQRKKHFQKSV